MEIWTTSRFSTMHLVLKRFRHCIRVIGDCRCRGGYDYPVNDPYAECHDLQGVFQPCGLGKRTRHGSLFRSGNWRSNVVWHAGCTIWSGSGKKGRGATAADTVQIYVYDPAIIRCWPIGILMMWRQIILRLMLQEAILTAHSQCFNIITGHVYDGVYAIDSEIESYIIINQPTGVDQNIQDLSYGCCFRVFRSRNRCWRVCTGGQCCAAYIEFNFSCDGHARWFTPEGNMLTRTFRDNQWHHFVGINDPIHNYAAMYVGDSWEQLSFCSTNFTGEGARIVIAVCTKGNLPGTWMISGCITMPWIKRPFWILPRWARYH